MATEGERSPAVRTGSGKTGDSYRLTPFLSPLGAWSYGIGTAIGWGSLVVTSNQYLLQAGPLGSVIGILVGTVVMVIVARNYAYMMNRYPDSGGSYTYVRHVLGYDFGFVLAWFLVLTYLSIFWANATSLPLFSRYFLGGLFKVGYLYTIFGYEVYLGEVILTMGAIAAIGLLCTRDKRHKQVIIIALALLFTAGITVCFLGGVFLNGNAGGSMEPAFLPDKTLISQVIAVGIMTPWAFIGFESISHSTEEFAFPRTQSFRILLAVVITTALLYCFVTVLSVTAYPDRYDSWFAYLSDLGNLEGIEGLPPFYAAYRHMGSVGVGILMASLLALVITSLIGNLVALSRLFVTLARDGVVSDKFSRLNAKGTPQAIILLISGVSLFIPLLGRTPIGWIVDITTIGACIVYGFVSLAELKIGRTENDSFKIAMGSFGFGVMALLALVTLAPSLVAAGSLARETYLLITIWAILGFIYFRMLLARDKDQSYGASIIVWVFLLTLVLFTSAAWMMQADQNTTNEAIANIQAHLEENYGSSDLSDEQAYIQAQMEQIGQYNTRSSLTMVGLFALAMGMMLSNYRFMRRRQEQSARALLAARTTAYTDSLTGVKNKHAYAEYEFKIDEKLESGELDELAVVVCDVNGLKFVNDTYGHASGDEYIKSACGIVCRHFEHSPVFRVGGDEFVVIPTGEDLENRDQIMQAFNEEVEGNIGTTNAVVSAGLSIFRPGLDNRFHDVFERADARMYQRKIQLKAMGAVTRD